MDKEQNNRARHVSPESIQEELRLLENFFSHAPALFCFLKEPEHIFQFANARFLEVFGAAEFKGKPFGDVYPTWQTDGLKKILDDVYNSGLSFTHTEIRVISRAGKEIFLDITCQAFKNEKDAITGVLFFAYEVTERVVNRRQVETNTATLEQHIMERTAMLQAANKSLEESNKSLREFASVASHDLQEPLRKIRTFAEIFRKQYASLLPEKGNSYIEKIMHAAVRMSTLIRDLLNYSKVISSQESFTPVSLNETVRQVIQDFDLLIEEKKAVVIVENELPVIEAIPLQMNQLFTNLLGNALKFSHPGRQPVVKISSMLLTSEEKNGLVDIKRAKDYLYITVTDNGIGFAPEFADQIFGVFERLNNPGDYEGSGIGLALCKRIVQNHRGSIRAESIENEQASFIIILPKTQ